MFDDAFLVAVFLEASFFEASFFEAAFFEATTFVADFFAPAFFEYSSTPEVDPISKPALRTAPLSRITKGGRVTKWGLNR